jgi:3-hydroxyisobutyrate dehydrogenase-like beta-hydroxyacid dehydrogenase
MNLGFVGLGSMGRAMALNILKAGHRLRVWNRSPAPLAELQAHGAEIVESPSIAFSGDACISMLADDEAVRAVVMSGRMIPSAGSSTVHVNMATVSVALARELSVFHAERGVPYVSAPVFGATAVAAAGQLNVVVAGDPASVELLQPVLQAVARQTWRLGDDPSRANLVKIAGNFMVASAIEAMAESAALVRANGMEPRECLQLLTAALFKVPVYEYYAGLIGEQRFVPPGFKLTLGLKGVKLALSAAEGAKVSLPFAEVVRQALLDAIAHGDGDKDWSAIAEVAERRARVAREA